MSKRRSVEIGGSPGDEVLTLINHRDAKYWECVCGHKIDGCFSHTCTLDIKEKVKLVFDLCDRDTCQVCKAWLKRERNLEVFQNQWYDDRDGYTRCEWCDAMCTDDIPKTCGCEWYIDEEGVDHCNTCHYWGYCRDTLFCSRCECSWYTDEEEGGRVMCSTCNKELKCKVNTSDTANTISTTTTTTTTTTTSSDDDDRCRHWYIDVEGLEVCGICHTPMYASSEECRKCGNNTCYRANHNE